MQRVPVISKDNKPLMPTKPSRARRWIKEGKAIGKFNDLGIFYVQLTIESSDNKTQSIAIGLDPGKLYSGIGVQSSRFTLWKAHLELPFKRIKERMYNRRLMRRGRRGRRINRKISFILRSHRQERFSNRRKKKLPPSIKANRQLEIRVISELTKIYPISDIYFEYINADVDLTSGRKNTVSGKDFSTVMVGQKWMIKQLEQFVKVHTRFGWQTSNLRKQLRLEKSKNKAEQSPNSHANDGIALACFKFLNYLPFHTNNGHGHDWQGFVTVTDCQFAVIKRPPISRRQLHLMNPNKGSIRRKYGGTTTRHKFRKGDLVKCSKGIGYVSGDDKTRISVSNFNWKRIGHFSVKQTQLIRRSTGLLVN